MEKPYPKYFKNPPLHEMVVELRFESDLPNDAIYGMIYQNLIKHFPNNKTLPIMNIPANVRNVEASMRYAPYYEFTGDSPLICAIGPRVIMFKYIRYTIEGEKEYPGWTDYIKEFVSEILADLIPVLKIRIIERIGIRYIDFFYHSDIYQRIKPLFEFPDRTVKKAALAFSIEENDITHNVNINNSVLFAKRSTSPEGSNHQENHSGSVIDIDTEMLSINYESFINNCSKILTNMHDMNKNLFYEIIKKELAYEHGAVFEGEE